jgi:hypothetical protein
MAEKKKSALELLAQVMAQMAVQEAPSTPAPKPDVNQTIWTP